jgi:hypothetical protein
VFDTFWGSALAQHDFLAVYIDAIVTPVFVERGDFGGFGYIFPAHIAFLSTVLSQF